MDVAGIDLAEQEVYECINILEMRGKIQISLM